MGSASGETWCTADVDTRTTEQQQRAWLGRERRGTGRGRAGLPLHFPLCPGTVLTGLRAAHVPWACSTCHPFSQTRSQAPYVSRPKAWLCSLRNDRGPWACSQPALASSTSPSVSSAPPAPWARGEPPPRSVEKVGHGWEGSLQAPLGAGRAWSSEAVRDTRCGDFFVSRAAIPHSWPRGPGGAGSPPGGARGTNSWWVVCNHTDWPPASALGAQPLQDCHQGFQAPPGLGSGLEQGNHAWQRECTRPTPLGPTSSRTCMWAVPWAWGCRIPWRLPLPFSPNLFLLVTPSSSRPGLSVPLPWGCGRPVMSGS